MRLLVLKLELELERDTYTQTGDGRECNRGDEERREQNASSETQAFLCKPCPVGGVFERKGRAGIRDQDIYQFTN